MHEGDIAMGRMTKPEILALIIILYNMPVYNMQVYNMLDHNYSGAAPITNCKGTKTFY